jgi:agmatinase
MSQDSPQNRLADNASADIEPMGPTDGRVTPRFAGPVSFARLPRPSDAPRTPDLVVFGVPFDAGTSYRPGTRFGPNHVRQSSRLLRDFNTELEVAPFQLHQVVDAGDLVVNPFDIPRAIEAIEEAARGYTEADASFLAIGGDHTISLPLLRAVNAKHGPVAVLHFDAHLDTWDDFFGQPYTHGTPFRRAREEGLIDASRSLHIGIRGPQYNDVDIDESFRLGYATISAPDYDRQGLSGVFQAMRERLGDGPVYVSVDIDVLDPSFAPATGSPEPGGISTRELLATLRELRQLEVVGADIVEVAPAYDHAEITGYAAAHIGFELLSLMSRRVT